MMVCLVVAAVGGVLSIKVLHAIKVQHAVLKTLPWMPVAVSGR